MRIISLDDKAPLEIVPVGVDFKNLVGSIDSVVVTVSVKKGTDASPVALLLGSVQITGTKAVHLMQAGLDGVIYRIRFDIVSGSEQYSEAVYLHIKELL